jgi:ketosteroid isomerase-like protein
MSEESTTLDLAERVRAIFEILDQHDWDALMHHYSQDVCWDATPTLGTTFDGQAAMRGLWQDWADLYEDLGFDLEELVELGSNLVLAVVMTHGHPVGSSGYVDAREAWIYEGADGMIVRVRTYRDIDEARAAAGRLAQERG